MRLKKKQIIFEPETLETKSDDFVDKTSKKLLLAKQSCAFVKETDSKD